MSRSPSKSAGLAFVDAARRDTLAALRVRLRCYAAALRAAAPAVADERDKWRQTFGEPFPASLEDWQRFVARFDLPGRYLPAEKITSGEWTAADVLPFVEGCLLRLKEVEPTGQADNKTDNGKKTKKILPDDPDVMKLVKKIKAELPKGGTKRDIALDFTGGDEKRARSLLKQLQPSRYGHLLE